MKKRIALSLVAFLPTLLQASEADLKVPLEIHEFGILHWGFFISILGIIFGIYQFLKIKKLPAHKSMLDIAHVIYKTCSTYLKQQAKFLAILFVFVGLAVSLYFGFLAKGENGESFGIGAVLLILLWTVFGILGSYIVAKYGIRINTYANSRMAFASLRRNPLNLLNIPLSAGMSIGVVLICVVLIHICLLVSILHP